MSEPEPARDSALFLSLVLGLQQSAMVALGKLQNPITRRTESHLDAARDTIDTLAALEARTRGNLSPEEARALQHVLTELRLNYLDEVRKGPAAPAAEPASE